MAGFITDEAFDAGLDYLDTNGTRVDIVDTAEPTTYSLATVDGTNSDGNKTGLNTAAPAPTARADRHRRTDDRRGQGKGQAECAPDGAYSVGEGQALRT